MRNTFGLFTTALAALGAGCAVNSPCVESGSAPSPAEAAPALALYRSGGDVYSPGMLSVRTVEVRRCADGAPTDLLIHAPEQNGGYPVVVFQHGFMSRNSAYDEILRHLAGHGFVVVAPQMYEPGLGALFGHPTAAEEAVLAAEVLDWLPGHLSAFTGVEARTDLLGLAGHSRGGKVAWLVLAADPARAQAIAGIDPVDGTGGPLGNQQRVVQGPFPFSLPSLVFGTGLGGTCAPAGDNHVQFYAASPSPAWHIVAPDAGHGDMLDEDQAVLAANVCDSGPDRAGVRRLTAGLLVAFFRGVLQGDPTAYDQLTDTSSPPVAIEVETK